MEEMEVVRFTRFARLEVYSTSKRRDSLVLIDVWEAGDGNDVCGWGSRIDYHTPFISHSTSYKYNIFQFGFYSYYRFSRTQAFHVNLVPCWLNMRRFPARKISGKAIDASPLRRKMNLPSRTVREGFRPLFQTVRGNSTAPERLTINGMAAVSISWNTIECTGRQGQTLVINHSHVGVLGFFVRNLLET